MVDKRLNKKGEPTELIEYASNEKDREIIKADEEYRAKKNERLSKKKKDDKKESEETEK